MAICHRAGLRLVTGYLVGASTALAFAPYQLWLIYPLAIAFALWQSRQLSPKASFFYWWTFGFGAFSVGISWVHVSMAQFGGMPLIASMALMALLALYLALYPAIAGTLAQYLSPQAFALRSLAFFPPLWIVTEWARGWVLTGFPWLWAGYSQVDGPLRPLAADIGTLGVSYLIIVAAAAIAVSAKRCRLGLTVLLALSVLTLIAYQRQPLQPEEQTVKVALVQGNIAQSMKWQPEALWPTLLKYMDLSRPVLDADIVIWPEAAVPAPEYMVSDFLDNANQVANLNDSAIITGIISHHNKDFYNSLIVLGNHHQPQQAQANYAGDGSNEYRKHQLLPIGEFVPFESLLRPLAPFFNLPMSSFARGDYQQPNLTALGYHIEPAICYEIAFPELLRANFSPQTDMLLTVSNDAWFGDSNGPLQHYDIARMRAVELGRPLLRGTNNGVTAVVDAQGNTLDKLPQFVTGVLSVEVPLVKGHTLFSQWGQQPILWWSGLLILFALIRRQRQA
ncbi:apolipoprotein N-acyltransferase [Shewanella sp. NIFS-20-20]|uniref:apolipoprotein N-acyltransferase n=1 Tax=Shewanella sp. NIFS-20-20 TaxID=2853806 RepID=UPI001C452A57|nr:apolipoprotein N-acyltransferase [Shewanella sp. NIFS-20-20]MBV7315885.1 apolipoprotein N-acyltransferase [Shewanella sp. NIFS-20-20]